MRNPSGLLETSNAGHQCLDDRHTASLASAADWLSAAPRGAADSLDGDQLPSGQWRGRLARGSHEPLRVVALHSGIDGARLLRRIGLAAAQRHMRDRPVPRHVREHEAPGLLLGCGHLHLHPGGWESREECPAGVGTVSV